MVPQLVHAFLRDVGGQQGAEQILEALGLPRQHGLELTLCQDPQMLHDEHALGPVQPVKHLCHELVTSNHTLCYGHSFKQSAKSVELRASHSSLR
eukprot:6490233-Amphidinium_carterae.1